MTLRDCFGITQAAGIALPKMYLLGFEHNNCLGCVKGGKGYWNKIRRLFPLVFLARARLQREMGVMFGGGDGKFWLDELGEDEGRDQKEPPIECGIFCDSYSRLLEITISAKP
jgi:hypothetical protein